MGNGYIELGCLFTLLSGPNNISLGYNFFSIFSATVDSTLCRAYVIKTIRDICFSRGYTSILSNVSTEEKKYDLTAECHGYQLQNSIVSGNKLQCCRKHFRVKNTVWRCRVDAIVQ